MSPAPRRPVWLPFARPRATAQELPTGEAFRPEWIDFERGIRVGNIDPHERITRILKYHLEQTYGTPFVTDRYGRGVYWQWICWLPRANREAKPISHDVNFGCAKLYLMPEGSRRQLQCGLQIERGYVRPPAGGTRFLMQADYDWHRFLAQCRPGSPFDREIRRLLRQEGFVAEIGNGETNARFDLAHFRSTRQFREALRRCHDREWVGFQVYYPLSEHELRACSGGELVEAIGAAFRAVVPAMNLCMQIRLEERGGMPP